MGIPAYYKKLVSERPTLVATSHPSEVISWLFMDFNCLIYHCLHMADCPVYPGDSQKETWEGEFLECVVRYSQRVIEDVSPQTGVMIAIDGVVPMAKMRQQRLRRFQSVWRREHSVQWDTNSITPGTRFMAALRERLERMLVGHPTWKLSSSDEPGEGEHKIMAEWRTGAYEGNYAVYGLDADLIVLSLLSQQCCSLTNQIWLFREEMEKGMVVYREEGVEQFEWFSIDVLRDWLTRNTEEKRAFLLTYCFAMSILGNDFLPSSLGLKMRDDGHSELLEMIGMLMVRNISLVYPHTQEVCMEGLHGLFRLLSASEEKRIEAYISKKQRFARGAVETGMGEVNWPLGNMEECALLEGSHLAANWQERYLSFFSGHPIKRMVHAYLYGIQWIWSYYTGRMDEVCFNWYYPFSLPPLWKWVTGECEFPGTVRIKAHDIRTVEQLALVLPLESWSLIPPCKEKKFPYLAPQFFPSKFTFESVGKRFFWECEAQIPMPSIGELKALMR
jgi:5'-3' exonuclease